MTLEIFSRDVVPIVGLLSLIAVYWQLNRTNRWNKINFTYNIINSGRRSELEDGVIEQFKRHHINIVIIPEIQPEHLDLIKSDQDLNNSICEYLNFLEYFCIATKHGAVEKDIAFDTMSTFVIEAWERYKIYIAWHRGDGEDVYEGIEKYAKKWQKRIDGQ